MIESSTVIDNPLALLLLLVVIPFVLFVVALFDVLRRHDLDGVTRLTWVVVVLVLPVVGAVLWFALRSRYGRGPLPAG